MSVYSRLKEAISKDQPQPESWWSALEASDNPYLDFMARRRQYPYNVVLGLDASDNSPVFSDAECPILVDGPAGSGKSVSGGAVAIMTAPGPCVSISSRDNPFQMTSLLRSLLGDVGLFDLDGETYAAGATRLIVDFLAGCEIYAVAGREARRWSSMQDPSESAHISNFHGHPHFQALAEQFLRPFFWLAAIQKLPLSWVYTTIRAGMGESPSKRFLKIRAFVQKLIDEEVPGAKECLADISFVLSIPTEEQGSVVTTAVNPLAGSALINESADDQNEVATAVTGLLAGTSLIAHEPTAGPKPVYADFDKFVRGDPESGTFDTWYFSDIDPESPLRYFQLVAIDMIREAAYRYAKERARAGLSRPMPTTFVHDELGVFPLNRLRQMLSEGRDRGIIVYGIAQTLSQLEASLGPTFRDDALSLFPNALFYPGVKDPNLLQLLSTLAGKYWVQVPSTNRSVSTGSGASTGEGMEWRELDVLRPDQIAHGHPTLRHSALFLDQTAHVRWIQTIPVFMGAPWVQMVVNGSEHANSDLPVPQLARDGNWDYLHQAGLADRYYAVQQQRYANQKGS